MLTSADTRERSPGGRAVLLARCLLRNNTTKDKGKYKDKNNDKDKNKKKITQGPGGPACLCQALAQQQTSVLDFRTHAGN